MSGIRMPRYPVKSDQPNDYPQAPGCHVDALWRDIEQEKRLLRLTEQMKLLRQRTIL